MAREKSEIEKQAEEHGGAPKELIKLAEKYGTTCSSLREFQSNLPVLSTGLAEIDMGLGAVDPVYGNGGVRARDMVEICGKNGSCKSAILYSMIAATQKRYPHWGAVAGVFSESLDYVRMEAAGIDMDKLIIVGQYHPNMDKRLQLAGPSLEALLELSEQDTIKMACVESIAGLATSGDFEKSVEAAEAVAALAKIYNPFSRRFFHRTNVACLIQTNHYKDKVDTGTRFKLGSTGTPSDLDFETIGGKTKDFLGKARILTTILPDSKTKQQHSGTKKTVYSKVKVTAKIGRNKYGSPLRSCELIYDTDTFEFNNEESILNKAAYFVKANGKDSWWSPINPVIRSSGAYWYIGDKSFQGTERAVQALKDDPELCESLLRQLMPLSKEFFLDKKDEVQQDNYDA